MGTDCFLKGEKIFLRCLKTDDDLTAYEQWVNDQDTTRYMAVGRFPMTKALLVKYIEDYAASKEFLLGIFTQAESRHVGNITLHQIDRQNQTAEIGILIGDKNLRGQGIGEAATRLVVEHAFNRLNLHKVTAGMIDGNVASRKMFEKVGFKQEGCLREQFYSDGRFWDCFRYGLLRAEYTR